MANDVSYIVWESAQARYERIIKRLWILCVIMFVAFVGSNAAWVYYQAQFDTVTTQIEAEQDAQDGNNYIVNGNYGETTGQNHDEETGTQDGRE